MLAAAATATSSRATGATFVYVANAQDGTISIYKLDPTNGDLQPAGSTAAGNRVGPLAPSPDHRHLYASIRTEPFSVATYLIDSKTGALTCVATAGLADSMAYISTDRSGRFLFGASYSGDVVSVNAIGRQGFAQSAMQVVKTGRHAHAILADASNRFVYATNLGTDQVLQFDFNERTGALSPNKVPSTRLPEGAGPRHLVFAPDGRFLHVLSELAGTVTTFAVDAATGNLTEAGSVEGVPKSYGLVRGVIRPPAGNAAQVDDTPRIWASDIHVTPDGKFLYMAERTSSSISAFACDPATGRLTFLSNVLVEKQPRGFNIELRGRFMVVAGEKSSEVGVYAIDPQRGALTRVGHAAAGQGANWVEIVEFN